MSVYNEDISFLKESIESILCQTYKNFEFIIVCDNPSNERIVNQLKEYARSDNRIIVHLNSQNIGLTKSLNVGLRICKGKYVARMDADDVALPNRLLRQVEFLEKNNSIVACSSSVRLIDAHGNIIGERHLSCSSKKIAVEGLFSSQLIHPASMIRRIVDGKVISYDETLRYAQDFGLWSSLPIGTLTNLNEILLLYRTTVTQITSLRRDEQIACARAVQLRNIERNGLLLCDNEKEVFDFLINGNDNLTVTQESIKILIYRIMDVFKGKVDKRLLFNYLALRYMSCLYCRGVGFIKLMRYLREFSGREKVVPFKPALYVLFLIWNR